MLNAILDFFCSRPIPESPHWKWRLAAAANVAVWAALLLWLASRLGLGFAVPGENMEALATFSGALPSTRDAFPLLWSLTEGLLGPMPPVEALNLLGAALLAAVAGLTLLAVRFWTDDAMYDDSIVAWRPWMSLLTANLAVALFVFSLAGRYALTGLYTTVWGFAWVLLCVVLQNLYARGGGHRHTMALAAVVLGVALVESPWAMALFPLFFLRALVTEWRLWDRNVRNLSIWFIALALGVAGMVVWNAWRMTGAVTLSAVWSVEAGVLAKQFAFVASFFEGEFIIHIAAAAIWPLLGWITARRLLNNDRAWGLLFTALVLSLAGFGLFYGVRHAPVRTWLEAHQALPLASAWITAVACGMLLTGWSVQLAAKNPNIFEELDRRKMPPVVSAMRLAAIFLVPLSLLAAGATLVVHGQRFHAVDRGMATRFAAETVNALKSGSGSPAEGRSYLLSTAWMDAPLALEAQAQRVPLTLFSAWLAQEPAYLESLHKQIQGDPLLAGADHLRLTNLLSYSFLLFMQDFFVSQENASAIAASFDLADTWYAARLRPLPCGTLNLGLAESAPLPEGLFERQQALQSRWTEALEAPRLPWYDLNVTLQRSIRHHLAFMANNLGTVLDDAGKLEQAAQCYLYAYMTDADNVSALLNLYDIAIRRGQLPDQRVWIGKRFETFIAKSAKAPRKYDLAKVGRHYGYIRNYALFVQMGWQWAISAAPESVLAGLRNAQSGLAPGDPRYAAVQAVQAMIYEQQGQFQRSDEGYRAAVALNPRNVEALRAMARISIQRGNTAEAGQWLAKAEDAGADQNQLDIDRTAYLMAIGDTEGARKAIGRYTTNNQDSPAGWAMLAMLEIESGNLDRVTGFISQQLTRTAKEGRELYFRHVIEGRIAQAEAQQLETRAATTKNGVEREEARVNMRQKWEDARNHYRRAFAVQPSVHGLMELILDIDRRLEDKASAEADALIILREVPSHAFANFVVGTQRLSDGHVEIAVKYFRLAAEGSENPPVDLVNNYADALSRTADTRLATEQGLRAIGLAPDNYGTWGTYALALARNREPDKARTTLQKARELAGGDDPRLGYVDIWIALAENKPDAARDARKRLGDALGDRLTPLDVRDLREIDDILARGTLQ